jgi:hypothetical protein
LRKSGIKVSGTDVVVATAVGKKTTYAMYWYKRPKTMTLYPIGDVQDEARQDG